MEEGGEGKVVCVTGGTGFLASWLIMKLLQLGYNVRATVRSFPDKDVSYLTNLPGAAERLQIFNADLDIPKSFNEAIKGSDGVFHLAHPMDFSDKESEEVVTQRSIEGTIGILKACLNAKTVKRVVYTSSAATVLYNGKSLDSETVDESSWSDIDYHRSLNRFGTSYLAAKVKTEKKALEFAERNGLDLVTVIPSLIVGPFICPNFPDSVKAGLAMILGNKDRYRLIIKSSMVHTDDVVRAQIFLLECPNAKGRYICSSEEISLMKMSEFLSDRYPEFQIPTVDSLKDIKGHARSGLSSKKLMDCGFKYKYGLGDMFDGAIQSCKEKGFL